jgi:hypothetical protein
MLVLQVLAAAVLLTLALYAQHRIVWASLASDPALRLLAFVQGFGAVHFPAALILFFKRARHEGRS